MWHGNTKEDTYEDIITKPRVVITCGCVSLAFSLSKFSFLGDGGRQSSDRSIRIVFTFVVWASEISPALWPICGYTEIPIFALRTQSRRSLRHCVSHILTNCPSDVTNKNPRRSLLLLYATPLLSHRLQTGPGRQCPYTSLCDSSWSVLRWDWASTYPKQSHLQCVMNWDVCVFPSDVCMLGNPIPVLWDVYNKHECIRKEHNITGGRSRSSWKSWPTLVSLLLEYKTELQDC